jgi:hypothetical protein
MVSIDTVKYRFQISLMIVNNAIVEMIFNKVGWRKVFKLYFPLFFNHTSSFFVDHALMTSFFVSQARLAVATP